MRTLLTCCVVVSFLAADAFAVEQERPLLKRPAIKTETLWSSEGNAEPPAAAIHPGVKLSKTGRNCVIEFPAREELPAVKLWSGGPLNLTGMDLLRLEVSASVRSALMLYVHDDSDQKRAAIPLALDPGVNQIAIPLWCLLREGSDDKLHIAKIKELQLALIRQAEPLKLKIASITATKVFNESEKVKFYRFGEGAPFIGATPVRPNTMYDAGRGYGLSGDPIGSRAWQWEFPLLGTAVSGSNLSFRCDLPDGDYEVQVVAFGQSWQGARDPSYKILANDAVVVDFQNTPEKFYSFDGHYYGANIFFDPSKTLFDQYHRKYYEAHKFETKAANGAINLKFDGCGVRALWIYPKAAAEEGRAFVDGCYAEEGHNLWLRFARVRDHAPTKDGVPPNAADTQRGYALFTRNYQHRVYPNSLPTKDEVVTNETGIAIAAAPGEFEPLTFVVRPTQDLGPTRIAYSDLVSGQNKIPAAQIQSFLIKYYPQAAQGMWYEAAPTHLYPYFDIELKKEWNQQYWGTLYVPPGTPGGDYKGTITITPQKGQPTTLPLTVTVHPFDLPKTKTECGMWNNTALSSHQTDAFPNNRDFKLKVLDAEIRNMAEHGLNCYAIGQPRGVKYDLATKSVTLDFSTWELLAEVIKKYNMPGRHKFTVWNIAKYGMLRPQNGFKIWTPEFNEGYIGVMRQCHEWLQQNGLRAVLQVTDEPRETELNDWNHNRVDCIRLLKLARQVPGMQTMITMMGDTDGFNRPYTPLIPLMDIMASHSWARSDDFIFLSTVEKLADYWSYNNGFTRFAHGFYLWKSKALGHWQWVHSWEVTDAHIPVHFSGDSSAVYVFPGGFLNTPKYEVVREGIDDHRYIELLNELLASAPKDAIAAVEAKKFLTVLEKFLPQYPHNEHLVTGAEAGGVYDESKETYYFEPWRRQIAEYITAIREKREPKKVDAAWAMFPKQLAAEQRKVVCKLVNKAPTIDGKGDDEVWAQAEEIGDFVNLARGVLAPIQTKVKMVCDGEKLYFLFTCIEPKYGELKAYAINRDEQCWEDDSVEAFIDAGATKKKYKHLIVNCLGTVQDSDTRDGLWNGDTQVAVSKDKGVWRAEFSVTLKSMGAPKPEEGAVWAINLCRNRQPAPAEISSWAFVGHSFHNPEGFGRLEFSK
ncbi:MAG TPA: sugar-binding protein [Planctomycetota bacterium]|nr:sugar-binding protein [Planctomycetota bacterium]